MGGAGASPVDQTSRKGATTTIRGTKSLEPGLLLGLCEGGCAPPSSPRTSVSPRGINRKKKKNLQIRRADAALDRSSEEVGSWVGHIRPAARLLGASWVMAMLGRVKKAGPSAQGKKEREALGPIQAETQSSIRSSWICVALTPLDLTELWA